MTTGSAPQVWLASELYFPEQVSTGYFVTHIAETLATEHRVRVVTAQPGYRAMGIRAPARETRNAVQIARVWSTRFPKDRLLGRLVNMVTFVCSTAGYFLLHLRQGDVLIAVTNPPVLPFLAAALCWIRGAKFVLLVHDVYPELLVAARLAGPRHPIVRLLAVAHHWLFARAERVVCLGRDMKAIAVAKRGRAEGVEIIPNWGDPDLVRVLPRQGHALLTRLGIHDRFVVLFMGNLGRTHGLTTVVEAVERLHREGGARPVHLLVVGSGAQAGWLRERAAGDAGRWLTVLGPCSSEELGEHLTACDLSIIAFKEGMKGVSVPSRMYNALAAGRPILAVAEEGSELALVVEEETAGWVVPPEDPAAIAGAIRAVRADPQEGLRRGLLGRAAAERTYKAHAVFEQWRRLISQVAGEAKG